LSATTASPFMIHFTLFRATRISALTREKAKNDREENPSVAALDWLQCPAVESTPGKVTGAWVLKGARMPVSVIFENLKLMSNTRNLMQRGISISRPTKIIIVWANQSCRTDCDFDPQLVEECK
jgi:hypothetical protein